MDLMEFGNLKQYHSVLTNGEMELEIYGTRHGCYIDPGHHLYGQDGKGNFYIDGKRAYVEVKER